MTQCRWRVFPKVSKGILGKGTESFGTGPGRFCSRQAVIGGVFCKQHNKISEHQQAVLAKRKGVK